MGCEIGTGTGSNGDVSSNLFEKLLWIWGMDWK